MERDEFVESVSDCIKNDPLYGVHVHTCARIVNQAVDVETRVGDVLREAGAGQGDGAPGSGPLYLSFPHAVASTLCLQVKKDGVTASRPIRLLTVAGTVVRLKRRGDGAYWDVDDGTGLITCWGSVSEESDMPVVGQTIQVWGKVWVVNDHFGVGKRIRVSLWRPVRDISASPATWLRMIRLHLEVYEQPVPQSLETVIAQHLGRGREDEEINRVAGAALLRQP
jgi:hypothetical protein